MALQPWSEQHFDVLNRYIKQLSPTPGSMQPPALQLTELTITELETILADLYYALGRKQRWAQVSVELEFPWYLDGLETPPKRAAFRGQLERMDLVEFNALTETVLNLVRATFLPDDSLDADSSRSPAPTEATAELDNDQSPSYDYPPLFPDALVRVRDERTKFPGDLTAVMSSRPEPLGHKSFNGTLYRAKYCGFQVTIKVLPEVGALAHARIISDQTNGWSSLKHPNLLPYLGHWAAQDRVGVVRPWVSDNIMSRLGLDTSLDPLSILVDVADVLSYLHEVTPQPIVHGNINPHNVLITDSGVVVLADWGVNSILDRLSVLSNLNLQLSADDCRYMAPELFFPFATRTPASDVFAFAVLCTELYSRQRPFAHLHFPLEVSAAVSRGERPYVPTTCTPGLRALLEDCWEAQAELRPSMQEVLVRLRRELKRRAAKVMHNKATPPSSPRLNLLGLDGLPTL